MKSHYSRKIRLLSLLLALTFGLSVCAWTGKEITRAQEGQDPEPPVEEPSFADFIERLYHVALDRDSEEEGKAYWLQKVTQEGYTGADCARFFLIDAEEFQNRNLSDQAFIETLYLTFFDRPGLLERPHQERCSQRFYRFHGMVQSVRHIRDPSGCADGQGRDPFQKCQSLCDPSLQHLPGP